MPETLTSLSTSMTVHGCSATEPVERVFLDRELLLVLAARLGGGREVVTISTSLSCEDVIMTGDGADEELSREGDVDFKRALV